MKRAIILAVIATLAISTINSGAAWAEESFFGRMNPFRILRKRQDEKTRAAHSKLTKSRQEVGERGINAPMSQDTIRQRSAERQEAEFAQRFGQPVPTKSHQQTGDLRSRTENRAFNSATVDDRIARSAGVRPIKGRFGQPDTAGSLPNLDEVRTQLEGRGYDSEVVDRRISRKRHGRGYPEGDWYYCGQPGSGTSADLSALRQELQQRGINPADVDQRIATRNQVRERSGRFGRQLEGAPAADFDSIRDRLNRQGVDPTSLNARFGSPGTSGSGAEGASSHASRYGTGRIRRR